MIIIKFDFKSLLSYIQLILYYILKGPPTSPTTTPRRQPPPPTTTPLTPMKWCRCGACNNHCVCTESSNFMCCGCWSGHCFPAAARVFLENGELIKMSELEIEDRVLTREHTGNILEQAVK